MSLPALGQLRCPQRCYLGSVVQTDAGPQVVLTERQIIPVDGGPDGVRSQAHKREVGPFPLGELDGHSCGCRHVTGEPLVNYVEKIRARVKAAPQKKPWELVIGPDVR